MITAYDALTAGIFDRPAFQRSWSAIPQRWSSTATTPPSRSLSMRWCRWSTPWFAAPGEALVDRRPSVRLLPGSPGASAGHRYPLHEGRRCARGQTRGRVAVLPQVEALVSAGIPVIGHLGLTPQSVNLLGGYRVQGRGESGELLLRDAKALESAGATAVVSGSGSRGSCSSSYRGAHHPDHRHRRGRGHRRPGDRLARPARADPRSCPAIRPSLCEPSGRDDEAVGRGPEPMSESRTYPAAEHAYR